MARPRVFKRPHVDDPKLKKILQQIDDEFSNAYQSMETGPGPTGPSVTGPTGPAGEDSVVPGPTGPVGPTGPGGITVIPVASRTRSYQGAMDDLDQWGAGDPTTWIVPPGSNGEWSGHDNEFATINFETFPWSWDFAPPEDGDIAFAIDLTVTSHYIADGWWGGRWVSFSGRWNIKYTDEYGAFELFE